MARRIVKEIMKEKKYKMDDIRVIRNKWEQKIWKDPMKHRIVATKVVADDSTPFVKRSDAKDIVITYNRANRIKTLRGIRKK